MIRAAGLCVHRGGRAILTDVDVTLPDGQVTAVVGPNGSGKSTLLRCLLRAIAADAGRIELDGRDLTAYSRRELARRIGYVAQQLSGEAELSVADEVALGALAGQRRFQVRMARVDEEVAVALETVGLADRATAPLAVLSGGERQRVAVARLLVQRPTHVLLDEPTNHLDPRHQLDVLAMMRRIAPTAVVVLHDLDLATRWCDRVVVLDEGRVAAVGRPDDVLTPDLLDRVYGVHTDVLTGAGLRHFAFSLPTFPPTRTNHLERNHL